MEMTRAESFNLLASILGDVNWNCIFNIIQKDCLEWVGDGQVITCNDRQEECPF